ncbi:PhzF family phenazine biosynthesis protein [Salinigranum halophilum]|jgi:trans-2,3-dihydro-3-hydroxyanthranilate isomerase|uniref:PhzF family phenazine biosynthesis protein n=1 Tax=Salinigranum halophilum TaxID=2565931 RepID=UPI00115F6155|nr:PhzF family phenazine biosynthesis protein [Salinigranum halophilum]
MSHRFHLVDVFAETPYSGNQLAVFHDTADLSAAEMQTLTREMNYSESTFVASTAPTDGPYDVRIFDPAEELAFAGHPTIGTAAVIREFVRDDSPDELTLSLGVGDISVTVEAHDGTERYWVHQVPPTFDETLDHAVAARILGLDVGDLDERYPVELVSTGLPTLVVPLRSLDALGRAATQAEPYHEDLIEPFGNVNLLVFAPETRGDADLAVRVFADAAGVPEDPATGSSNGCLAAYLVAHRYFDADELDISVEQGHEMGRPSLLHLRAHDGDDISVSVGGRVQPVAEGRLL